MSNRVSTCSPKPGMRQKQSVAWYSVQMRADLACSVNAACCRQYGVGDRVLAREQRSSYIDVVSTDLSLNL